MPESRIQTNRIEIEINYVPLCLAERQQIIFILLPQFIKVSCLAYCKFVYWSIITNLIIIALLFT